MGIKLVEEVLDHAPPELTSGERLLLVVIAQNANETTRQGWPGMELLAHRTGMKPEGVRKALRGLTAKGVEVRTPIGEDKKGRAVYAAKGHRTVYEVPRLVQRGNCGLPFDEQQQTENPSTVSREGVTTGPEGVTTGPQRGNHGPTKASPQSPPSPHISSGSPQDLFKTTPPPPEGECADDETEVVEAEIVDSDDYWAEVDRRLMGQPRRSQR